MPAHGASSSHDRRSPTMRSAPSADRTAVITSRANRSRSWPHSSSRWLVSPLRNWRTRLCWPALISTPSTSASTAELRGRREPVDDRRDVVGLHPLGDLAGVDLRNARRRPQRGLAVGRRTLAAGVVERRDHQRSVRAARVDDGRPTGQAALGQRSPFVRPVGTVDRCALDDDRAAAATGPSFVVRDVPGGQRPVVGAEVGDVRAEHDAVAAPFGARVGAV